MITIGIDPHSRTHWAAALDDHGRVLAEVTVGRTRWSSADWRGGSKPWVRSGSSPSKEREDSAWRSAARLLGAGETVLDVAPALTASERRSSRRPGKDDRADAVAVARVALRDANLPSAPRPRGRTSSCWSTPVTSLWPRRRAPGTVCTPSCWRWLRATTIRSGTSRRPRGCSSPRASPRGPGGRTGFAPPSLARAVTRLRSLSGEIDALEREITRVLDQAAPANLLSICGVGPLVAAKILGEVREVTRFPSGSAFAAYAGTAPIPASSGTVIRHRLHRGGNRQLNRALHTVALTQARRDDRARAFLARKRAEGKTPREARRALKRHLAAAVYRALLIDAAEARTAAA